MQLQLRRYVLQADVAAVYLATNWDVLECFLWTNQRQYSEGDPDCRYLFWLISHFAKKALPDSVLKVCLWPAEPAVAWGSALSLFICFSAQQWRAVVHIARESILSKHFSRAERGRLCPKPLKGAYTPPLITSKQAEGSVGNLKEDIRQMWTSEWVIEENWRTFISRWPLPLSLSPQVELGVRNVLSESTSCNLLCSHFLFLMEAANGQVGVATC